MTADNMLLSEQQPKEMVELGAACNKCCHFHSSDDCTQFEVSVSLVGPKPGLTQEIHEIVGAEKKQEEYLADVDHSNQVHNQLQKRSEPRADKKISVREIVLRIIFGISMSIAFPIYQEIVVRNFEMAAMQRFQLTTTGQVTSSDVRNQSGYFGLVEMLPAVGYSYPSVQYRYSVAGHSYSGIDSGDGLWPAPYADVKQMLENSYPTGQSIVVRYKKDDPAKSKVFDRGQLSKHDILLMFLFYVLGGFALYAATSAHAALSMPKRCPWLSSADERPARNSFDLIP